MIKTSTPADTDTGAAIIAQMLANDKQNLTQDENAVLNSGISEGMVVKWSASQSKWLICDGTVALLDTDSIGIVTYADGTSGQVKTSGVYVNDDLSTVGKYYCQSDGSIGTTMTKVFIGNITSPGRLCLPGGSGGGGNIATTTSLGQVMIGDGIDVDSQGKISSPHGSVIYTTPGTYTWTCPTGVTSVLATVIGAGGGGTGGAYWSNGTTGGGGNILDNILIPVTAGQGYSVIVGKGGTGSSPTTGDGQRVNTAEDGGQSSFNNVVSLGGQGGYNDANNNNTNTCGSGRLTYDYVTYLNSGNGTRGGGQLGGLTSTIANTAGNDGNVGCGGGGGYGSTNESQRSSGGAGGPGMVIIKY